MQCAAVSTKKLLIIVDVQIGSNERDLNRISILRKRKLAHGIPFINRVPFTILNLFRLFEWFIFLHLHVS